MSIQRDNLLIRLISPILQSTQSVWFQIVSGVGAALDTVDPSQNNLAQQFSVTTATGDGLDRNGADWGIVRRTGEDDDTYRKRILAELPQYLNGPTLANIKSIVRAFTGMDPEIFEYGPDSFTMGASVMGTFGFSSTSETFNFLVTVKDVKDSFNKQDLIDAINTAKPARSTAEFQFVIPSWAAVNGTWESYSNLQLNQM